MSHRAQWEQMLLWCIHFLWQRKKHLRQWSVFWSKNSLCTKQDGVRIMANVCYWTKTKCYNTKYIYMSLKYSSVFNPWVIMAYFDGNLRCSCGTGENVFLSWKMLMNAAQTETEEINRGTLVRTSFLISTTDAEISQFVQ